MRALQENAKRQREGQAPLCFARPSAYFYIEGTGELQVLLLSCLTIHPGSAARFSTSSSLSCGACAMTCSIAAGLTVWLCLFHPRTCLATEVAVACLFSMVLLSFLPRYCAPAGTFYNDLRQPGAADYSAPILQYNREHNVQAPPHPLPGSRRTNVLTTGECAFLQLRLC